jgi:hypothetical protein
MSDGRPARALADGNELQAVEGLTYWKTSSLSGKARWSWQHPIPAAKALRYSVKFRTLKRS